MEGSKHEFAEDTAAEQLATANCISEKHSGGGRVLATAKADHLAVDCFRKKCTELSTGLKCATMLSAFSSRVLRVLRSTREYSQKINTSYTSRCKMVVMWSTCNMDQHVQSSTAPNEVTANLM